MLMIIHCIYAFHNLDRIPADTEQGFVIGTVGDSDDELFFLVCYCILEGSVLKDYHSR